MLTSHQPSKVDAPTFSVERILVACQDIITILLSIRHATEWITTRSSLPSTVTASQTFAITERRREVEKKVNIQTLRASLSCRCENSSVRGNLFRSNNTFHHSFVCTDLTSCSAPSFVIKDFSIILKLILHQKRKRVPSLFLLSFPSPTKARDRFKWQFSCVDTQVISHSSSALSSGIVFECEVEEVWKLNGSFEGSFGFV